MKSQVKLLQCVLKDSGRMCGTSTTRDMNYITRRLSEEGDSFLTITLPTFNKGLLRALDRGYIGSDLFPGFKRGKGGLPCFLSGFLNQIFGKDGTVVPTTYAVTDAIRAVRQITCLFSKYEADCSDERVKSAFVTYAEVDDSLEEPPRKQLDDLYKVTRILRPYFYKVESELWRGLIKPTHGPGAVAERLRYNQKFSSNVWTDRLERVFPAYQYLHVNARDWVQNPTQYLSPEQEPPVRVVSVPKTMKSPRIIAIEPTWTQYVQHGIEALMTDTLYLPQFAELANCFGWLDQEPSRLLAQKACDGDYATIDLSEASDRVHLSLIKTILRDNPFLLECVLACRSERAELPDGTILSLKKFASMGSALCFPFETIVFTSIILLAIACVDPVRSKRRGRPWSSFRVYGDDMIVPVDIVPSLIPLLEAFGLKVNIDKSFWTGKFRESCGADWYDGVDVNYVKVRHPLPERRQHALEILEAIDLHNRFFEKGYEDTCDYLAALSSRLGYGYRAPEGSKVVALYTRDDSCCTTRYNRYLQRVEYKSATSRSVLRDDPLNSYGALRKCLRYEGKDPLNKGHLEHAGRSLHVAINVGWQAL